MENLSSHPQILKCGFTAKANIVFYQQWLVLPSWQHPFLSSLLTQILRVLWPVWLPNSPKSASISVTLTTTHPALSFKAQNWPALFFTKLTWPAQNKQILAGAKSKLYTALSQEHKVQGRLSESDTPEPVSSSGWQESLWDPHTCKPGHFQKRIKTIEFRQTCVVVSLTKVSLCHQRGKGSKKYARNAGNGQTVTASPIFFWGFFSPKKLLQHEKSICKSS